MMDIVDETNQATPVNSFNDLILHQINVCREVLNKEVTGGHFKIDRNGQRVYVEDVRELIINSVGTLEMLLSHTLNKEKEEIQVLKDNIESKREELGKKKQYVKGVGNIEIKDLPNINPESPVWKEYVDFKCDQYRQIFRILVKGYVNKKILRI